MPREEMGCRGARGYLDARVYLWHNWNPKGVMVTHQMYVAAGQGFATWTSATPDDRFFTCMPFFHANPHYYSTMGLANSRSKPGPRGQVQCLKVLPADPRVWSHGCQLHRNDDASNAQSPPSESDRDHAVRLYYGSPAPSPEMLAEFEERFGSRVIIGFGMTESCYGTVETLDQPHRPGTAGIPRWHPDPRFKNQLRITDDSGKSLGPREVGEITLKSPAVTPGYWDDPERTAEALKQGWLYTGDLGWVDEDGYLYFVDRKKDVIRRRGENISSQEVENVIRKHPGVVDCAVIGVPSDLGDYDVKAYVVPHSVTTLEETGTETAEATAPLSPADIIYWCADHLAYFKVPRYLEFRPELPKTPTCAFAKTYYARSART